MSDWAAEIIDSMRGLCELLDEGDAQRPYLTALELQEEKIRDCPLTPAARSLHEMRTNEESFFNFALRMSKVHQSYFKDLLSPNSSRQEQSLPPRRPSRSSSRRDRGVGHDFLRRISRPLFLASA